MKIKNYLVLVLIVGVGIMFAGGNLIRTARASDAPTIIKKMSVSTGPTVTTTSSVVLPASSSRIYAILVNDGTVPVYLTMTGGAAVASTGIRLNANGGSYELNLTNLYIGDITAITGSGTAVLTVSAAQ